LSSIYAFLRGPKSSPDQTFSHIVWMKLTVHILKLFATNHARKQTNFCIIFNEKFTKEDAGVQVLENCLLKRQYTFICDTNCFQAVGL